MNVHELIANGGGDRIGGSSYRYKYKGTSILVDFGAIQDEAKSIKYLDVPVEPIELLFLGHDHIDHCGGLPIFAREHPETKIYMTKTCRDGMELQLYDSVKISLEQYKNGVLSNQNPKPPLFEHDEVRDLIARVRIVRTENWFEPIPGFKVSFRSAGHKLGAAIILIVFPDGTRVMHACDYCLNDQALVRGAKDPKDFLEADLMLTESTYGARELPERAEEEARLVNLVTMIIGRGGKVVIPHFSSTGLHVALPLARAGLPTLIDGMLRDFSKIYRLAELWTDNDIPFRLEDYPTFDRVDGVKFGQQDSAYRKMLIQSESSFVVVSSSGMLQGGPAVGYVEELVGDPKNAIIIPGYQAPETQGRKLLQLGKGEPITFHHEQIRKRRDGSEYLDSFNVTREVLCDVIQLHLSGHSGGNRMAEWIAQINPKRVVTVHGDPEGHQGLADRIHGLKSSIDVVSARNGEAISF